MMMQAENVIFAWMTWGESKEKDPKEKGRTEGKETTRSMLFESLWIQCSLCSFNAIRLREARNEEQSSFFVSTHSLSFILFPLFNKMSITITKKCLWRRYSLSLSFSVPDINTSSKVIYSSVIHRVTNKYSWCHPLDDRCHCTARRMRKTEKRS